MLTPDFVRVCHLPASAQSAASKSKKPALEDTKSTAAPSASAAAVLHDMPEYSAKERASTLLLYPSKEAVYLDDESIDIDTIDRIIVVESTWHKVSESHIMSHGFC